ncbi:TetR/AcrR family transcriptional regulator [Nocardia sp. NPDC052566]|uniref:TetR/AcrR family transcriptional regulator n=1 Tax=Nocardia sp. NPDC052566 TaxID=3364330 RepID=UPI0037CCB3DA
MSTRTRADDAVGTSRAAARIRAAATEMFAARGYGETSMRDIAARLGLSPGAVYPHYKTKESLLFAIALEGHRAVLSVLAEADSPQATPGQRLAATFAAFVRFHADNHAQARVVQYELRSLSEESFKQIAAIRRATSKIFLDIVKTGCEAGDFDAPDVDAAVLAITSLGIDVSRWFPARGHRDPQALAAKYTDLCLRMVGAQPRPRLPRFSAAEGG